MNNLFISIEGIDGSGKSTLASFLSKELNLEKFYQGLSLKIGKEKYNILRTEIHKNKNKKLVDFYYDSYKGVSNYKRVIADRYIGSLWFWGKSSMNERYMLNKFAKLRKPHVGILVIANDEELKKRHINRNTISEISKIKKQAKLIKETKFIYEKLGIPLIVLDSSLDLNIVRKNVLEMLWKYVDDQLIDSEREFKLFNILQSLGFCQNEYNLFKKDDFIFDLSTSELKTKYGNFIIEGKKDYPKFIYIVNEGWRKESENIHFGAVPFKDIKYYNFKIDNGIFNISHNLYGSDFKTNNVINGDAYIDSQQSDYVIKSNITQIGDNPFAGWKRAPKTLSSRFVLEEDFLIDNKTNKLIAYFGDGENVLLPETIESIGKHAFYGKNLTKMTIGENIKIIFNNPFSHSDNVNVINNSKYFNIVNGCLLTAKNTIIVSCFDSKGSLCIEKGIKKIGKNSFFKTKNLKELVINEELEYIGFNPFVLSGISEIRSKSNKFIVIDDILYSSNKKLLYFNFSKKENIILPDETEIICRNAMRCCKYVKNVYLGKNMKIIQKKSFNQADNLEKVIYCLKKPKIEMPNKDVIYEQK